MDQSHKASRKPIIITFAIIITLIIAGTYCGKKWHDSKIKTALNSEKATCQKQLDKLKNQIDDLHRELALKNDAIIPKEESDAVFTELEGDEDCSSINRNIDGFFSYLDNKYFQSNSKISSRSLFHSVSGKMNKKRPHFSDQASEVLTLLRSMSHFCRLLGKENLLKIRAILNEEEAMLEPAMKYFYQWLVLRKECIPDEENVPDFDTLYQYACFFQNTLAGKSYLFRRTSKIRLLTTYYAVLVIDRATDKSMNIYGFDIRPVIRLLKDDIDNHKNLLYKKEYLRNLKQIEKKYPKLAN